MTRIFATATFAFCMCLFAASTASADIYSLTASGTWVANYSAYGPGYCFPYNCFAPGDTWTYSFEFNTATNGGAGLPTPDSSFIEGGLYDVKVFDNSTLVFSNPGAGGSGEGVYFINPTGPVGQLGSVWDPYAAVTLFTGNQALYVVGTESNPVFLPGTYTLTDAKVGGRDTLDPSTITFTDLTTSAATPEPGYWVLTVGCLAFLVVMRIRRAAARAEIKAN